MLIESLSHSSTDPLNTFKYNGIHFEREGGLNSYIAPFRTLDPTIARWNSVDPMNQFLNPYVSMGGDPVSFSDPLGLYINFKGNNVIDNPTLNHLGWMDREAERDFQRSRNNIFGLLRSLGAVGGGGGIGLPYSAVNPEYSKEGDLTGWQLDYTDWFNTGGYTSLLMQEKRVTFNPQRGTWGRWEEFSSNEGTYIHTSNTVIDGEFGWIANGGSVEIGWEWKSFSTVDNRSWLEDLQTGLESFDFANGGKNTLIDYAAKTGNRGDDGAKYLKISKGLSRGAGVLGLGATLADAAQKGQWQNHHTADLVVGIATTFMLSGPWGWAIGGVYFLTDIAVQSYTGRSITENLFDPTPTLYPNKR